MRICGTDYSSNIDRLYTKARAWTQKPIRFVQRSELSTLGQVITEEDHVRIELKPSSPEFVVAHELLHLILDSEAYPRCRRFSDNLENAWKIGNTIAMMIKHVEINRRLIGMAYPIGQHFLEMLRNLITSIQDIREQRLGETHFAVFKAGVLALYYELARPFIRRAVADGYRNALEELPKAFDFGKECLAAVRKWEIGRPESQRACVIQLLRVTERHFGQDPEYRDLVRKVHIQPYFLSAAERRKPAREFLDLYPLDVPSPGESFVWLLSRKDGSVVHVEVFKSKEMAEEYLKKSSTILGSGTEAPLVLAEIGADFR